GGEIHFPIAVFRRDHASARRGDAGGGDEALGAVFVERGREGERIRAGVRNAKHLEDRRNAGLAGATDAVALGEVEHELRRIGKERLEHVATIAQQNHIVPQAANHRGDGVDRGGAVELFFRIVGAGAGSLWVERDTDSPGGEGGVLRGGGGRGGGGKGDGDRHTPPPPPLQNPP